MHSPTAALIGISIVLACFLRSNAILTAMIETNVAAMTMMATMTAMVMTMLSDSVAELCCTEI